MIPKARYQLEVLGGTHPVEEWMPLRKPTGSLYKFVERSDAEEALALLKRVQPHAVFRIREIG